MPSFARQSWVFSWPQRVRLMTANADGRKPGTNAGFRSSVLPENCLRAINLCHPAASMDRAGFPLVAGKIFGYSRAPSSQKSPNA